MAATAAAARALDRCKACLLGLTKAGDGMRRMMTMMLVVLLLLLLEPGCVSGEPNVVHEVCQWENFEASCGDDEVIVMEEARYGRMRRGRCVQQDMGHLGCSADVLDLAHGYCSGRGSCRIEIPDPAFDKRKPCSELQNYFSGKYKCLKVETIEGTRSVCQSCDFVKAKGRTGYISNYVTQQTGCGSTSCPWLINAASGQRIRLSLMDYGSQSMRTAGSGSLTNSFSAQGDPCKVYAVLKDTEYAQNGITLCGGKATNQEVFVSQGHAVEVRLMPGQAGQNSAYFVLQYEVIGCPTLHPPGAAELKEIADGVAIVTCAPSGESWTLQCNGSHWLGAMGKCSEATSMPFSVEESLSNGVSVAIVVGVAIVICALVVVIGLACYRLCTNSVRHEIESASLDGVTRTPQRTPQTEPSFTTYQPCDIRFEVGSRTIEGEPCPGASLKKLTAAMYTPDITRNQYEQICDNNCAPRTFVIQS